MPNFSPDSFEDDYILCYEFDEEQLEKHVSKAQYEAAAVGCGAVTIYLPGSRRALLHYDILGEDHPQ